MNTTDPGQSPIKRFPDWWKTMNLDQKRQWLVDDGQAADWSEASSLLSRHGHAFRVRRKMRSMAEGFAKRIAAGQPATDKLIEPATVSAKCDGCGRVCYQQLFFASGRREKKVIEPYQQQKTWLLCYGCLTSPQAESILQRAAQDERRAA